MIDKILMDDCVFTISDKLNKNGYEMELTNDDKVLSITSKDGLYSCKIARFSSINPFELTEDQEKKLADIYDKLSDEAYEKINVSKDDENYYDVFFEQYDKEKENSKELADFYDDNNINRFTSFDGFTEREMKENVWGLLDINTDELEWIMENKSWYRNLLYKTSDSDVHLCELSKEKLPFAGIFVIMETYEGDYDNNEVDFWIF